MTLRIAFRADASLEIGTGHIARCLTLAQALRDCGAGCHFIMRAHSGHQIDVVRERGFRVTALDSEPKNEKNSEWVGAPAHAAWLGSDWRADAQQTRAALEAEPVDWLVVDHYALDAQWERELHGAFRRLMVIDDLADRPHYCDMLLDQNLGRVPGDYAGLVPTSCTVLTGPVYALLRPEFAAQRAESLRRRSRPRLEHLLIALGGIDRGNATGRVLAALQRSLVATDCRVTVVMGRQAPSLRKVQDQARDMPWPCKILVQVDDMASLMSKSDLAIGAAGGSAWERCVVGLPCLLLVLADNQRAGARALAEAGAAVLLNDINDLVSEIPVHLASLQREGSLTMLVEAASAVTDGRGLERVVPSLLEPALG